jgi:nucleoside-diphosphate-sugar epimerase
MIDHQKLKNKNIAVLGTGYLGSNLSSYLRKLNIQVTEIKKTNLKSFENKDFDYFINCAGNSGDFRDKLIETVESNVTLNCYILQNIKIRCCYLYISSSRVYGYSKREDIIFDENYFYDQNSLSLDYIYDGSKKLSESILLNYSKKVDYKIGILRLSNVYGNFNNLNDSTLIKKIIRFKKQSLNNLQVKENRHSRKDYIHINDVVESIIKVILNIKKTDIFNLAYGKSYSLDDISSILNLKINSDESNEPRFSIISPNKIKEEFSLSFNYDFKKELKKI